MKDTHRDLEVLAEENLRLKGEVHRLTLENRKFFQAVESLKRQEKSLSLELLKERLWRISFQMAYLRNLEEKTKQELDAMEHGSGFEAGENAGV